VKTTSLENGRHGDYLARDAALGLESSHRGCRAKRPTIAVRWVLLSLFQKCHRWTVRVSSGIFRWFLWCPPSPPLDPRMPKRGVMEDGKLVRNLGRSVTESLCQGDGRESRMKFFMATVGTGRMLHAALRRLEPYPASFGGISVTVLCSDIRERIRALHTDEPTFELARARIIPVV
jgi:hypothetical protein